jgi:hypothetical protein
MTRIGSPSSSKDASRSFEDTNRFQSLDPHAEIKPPRQALRRDGPKPRVRESKIQAKDNLDLVRSNIATIRELTIYADNVRAEVGLLFHGMPYSW